MAATATSRVTAQNQISIPASIRRRFGIVAGTELVWEDQDGVLVIRRKKHTIEDLRAITANRPVKRRTLRQIRAAMDRARAEKYGRG